MPSSKCYCGGLHGLPAGQPELRVRGRVQRDRHRACVAAWCTGPPPALRARTGDAASGSEWEPGGGLERCESHPIPDSPPSPAKR